MLRDPKLGSHWYVVLKSGSVFRFQQMVILVENMWGLRMGELVEAKIVDI